ncbi:acyltransferase family protein [Hufsiella ginkgonis]|uniref:Acyltransferase family protein n=1 Tax=Hufsiella ginkgonis TaxID=2695274 RepID=A0A7K1XZR3_9SPHI|nr:acyltransferase [Hufsiella ginkgonis]MXV16026.1 acyltransferase family protein [Hufsiella ginkgonis]
MNRIKSLDGLRAISIILVLIGHCRPTMPPVLAQSLLFDILPGGALGVNIFFVISGYLITRLLIAEKNKTGRNSLKQFYLRRILRIFPVFYLYILVIILLKVFFMPDIINGFTTVAVAGLYLWNYAVFFHFDPGPIGGWFLGHFWSLAMEEQFYLLWPLAFVLAASLKKLKKAVVVIILLMPVIRVGSYFLVPMIRPEIGLMLHTAGDYILTGCLGALIEMSPEFEARYLKYVKSKLIVIVAFFCLLVIDPVLTHYFAGAYNLSVGMSANNLFILIILFWSMYVPSWFQRMLNKKLMVRIGLLSYSLYIWQQLILTPHMDTWLNKFPQNLVVVFLIALLSYHVVEKPVLRLKERFKAV